jgi:indolepyruvate ferredoxin oxidoreductase, alpha subunit
MERSFAKEIQALKRGEGEVFHGEGILAVTKALLQSGVSYVGGYQGAPVSHLLDVMVEAEDLLGELGVHVEACTNEASAAAMLGASINYPIRGAVTWKSIVGTNVAADALSNLASPGVLGGALIVIGEDYGEGASVIQERSYAYALKSTLWLLDPRPDLPTIVRMVEKGFELSEASHTPVMLELRIRACHVTGEFIAKDNRKAAFSRLHPIEGPPRFDYARLAHPPLTYAQEKLKVEARLPAARAFIRAHQLNEMQAGDLDEVGIVVLGGLYNSTVRALARLGLADADGRSRIPLYVMNVAYPIVPEEVRAFCAGKRAVLVVEEGNPEYVEQAINVELRLADIATRVAGKAFLPKAGEYVSDVLLGGLAQFLAEVKPCGVDAETIVAQVRNLIARKAAAATALGDLPARPPTFCTGCPERPVFSALKLVQRQLGPTHISADIGCHSFATFAPFSMGNSILGYGMSLASAAAVSPNLDRRPIAVMGDGGFWHNGMITGVASSLFNNNDGVLVIMQNGYTSATGQQFMPSSAVRRAGDAPGMDIETTLRAMGVTWMRKVRTYSVAGMVRTLKEAMRSAERGLKVIIADGECMLARQRRLRTENAGKLERGERVATARYGVDDEICTGDHSCIRLSGCPSLTVKPNPDSLRTDPVAAVIESCVGCGLCGEVAHAAVLCPSFYRAEVVRNAGWWERGLHRLRRGTIGWLAPAAAASSPRSAAESREEAPALADGAQQGFDPPPQESGGRVDARTDREAAAANAGPIKILIAALGGEGGGVLTQWIVDAAARQGFAAQSTSIPGVAQRTGATTYYIEIFPRSSAAERRPVLALAPGVGDVDLMVASELLEAGRAVSAGFVTPERTLAIASTSRSYIVTEKMAMGDGRFDPGRLLKAVRENAREQLLFDMEETAKESGAMINAVMLGAIAACGRLPLTAEAFEQAIRQDGKAVDSNLRGFRAGLQAARRELPAIQPASAKCARSSVSVADFERELAAIPAAAHAIVTEGVRRLIVYQSDAYARLYLDRLRAIAVADANAQAHGRLLCETARHLALRMSYEDVIRVARAKIEPERLRRIDASLQAPAGAPVVIAEFLRPGVEELASLLSPRLARRVLAWAERSPRLGKLHWGMEVRTTSVSGYLRFRLLAGLRRWRPRTFRYQQEQAAIETWLGRIVAAAARSRDLALEVAECARLIKGYGDTLKRGIANHQAIDTHVVQPALCGDIPSAFAADAIASARTAALRDPEGEALSQCLAAIQQQRSFQVAAK